jgi:outer membrane protein
VHLLLPILLQTGPVMPTRVLRLSEAVKVALEHQPSLLQAQANTRAAEARTAQARSGYLPQITGTALYQHGYRSAATTVTTPPSSTAPVTTTGIYDFFSVGANASQLLWDFGQTIQRTNAASGFADSARMSQKAATVQVVLNVRRAYFNARAQKALVRVADETLANQTKHLQQITGFVTVGTRPEIDLAQSKSDVASQRFVLINAQNAYQISKSQLAVAMGVATGGATFEVADEDIGPVPGEDQPIAALVGAAATGRPELAALERQRDAQEKTVTGLKGAFGPSLSAIAGASETGPALGSLGPNWNVGALLSWPLLQGGLTLGQIHEAEANVDATQAQLEATKLAIRLDVEQAVLSVRAAKAGIFAARDALTSARERLRLAEGRYVSGVGTIIELGDSQIAVASAAAQVVAAEYNLSSARAQLVAAMGKS